MLKQSIDPISYKSHKTLLLLLQEAARRRENDTCISQLIQDFEILDFQLGYVFSLENFLENCINDKQNLQYFYLICDGRVRLLSFDSQKKREVSTQLLKPGETLGGDSLLCEISLPYRAIAASSGQAARISLDKLQLWLEKLPSLKESWLASAWHRQCLIFFKTLTPLRSLTSERLQQLSPYLSERKVAAGESLAQVTPAEAGRFWLRQGQIQNCSLEAGCSWGYPEATPVDWVAQTELWVYQLSQQNWEVAREIAPVLEQAVEGHPSINGKSLSSTLNGHFSQTSPVALPSIKRFGNIGDRLSLLLPKTSTSPPSQRQTESGAVEFPNPSQGHRRMWRGYPFVEQQSSSDCGAACLAAISHYWGKYFSINMLRELAGIGRGGATLKNLAKASENLGYEARPVRASLNRLADQSYPWIAHWQGDHYIVVYSIKGDRVLIADPAKGKYKLSRQDFIASWTGYALLLSPTERLYETPDEKKSLGRFLTLLWPYRSLGLQIILISFLIQIFGIVSPLFTQIIIDQVVVNRSQSALNIFILGSLLFGIWGMSLSAIRQYLLSYFSNRLNLTMVSGFIKHSLALPLKFFESRRVGDILTRVGENVKIQRFLLGQVLLSWLDFVTGFVYLGLMLYYNWKLTLLVLALVPPILILALVVTPVLRKLSREQFSAVAEQSSSLVEMMTGVATVKASAAEQELRWRWEELFTNQLNIGFKGQKFSINIGVISSTIDSIGGLAVLWYGATLVIQEQLTIGQLVAFNMMQGYIISPIIALVGLWDELQEVLISVERLNDVFDTKPEVPHRTSMVMLPSLQGNVRLENVTFRYDADEDRNVLQNISFEASVGQTIAIVGRSGSGKSTLVKLLQGLYHPTKGSIWIDEHDIRHVSPQSLRSQLGVVPQECFLFSGTISENITLYRPEYTLDQVIEVAKLAEAHTFIQAMPLGYKTKVGERGANLSGGQRQRIAIARALLGNPRILILDEATSSLDTESERRFQENLARFSRDRTTFIIAHRLSTVRNADHILVLDRGLLVEQGNHEELMALKGLYYYLAQQQLAL